MNKEQVINMYRKGVITPTEASNKLRDLGATEAAIVDTGIPSEIDWVAPYLIRIREVDFSANLITEAILRDLKANVRHVNDYIVTTFDSAFGAAWLIDRANDRILRINREGPEGELWFS
jgi:thermostable 8-oxoguanine DNA glycosylase